MSDKVGLICYSGSDGQNFWNSTRTDYSQEVLQIIDHEVKTLIEEAHRKARHILTSHRDHLDLVASKLLEYETLSGADITTLLTGGTLPELPKVEESISELDAAMEQSHAKTSDQESHVNPMTPDHHDHKNHEDEKSQKSAKGDTSHGHSSTNPTAPIASDHHPDPSSQKSSEHSSSPSSDE